MIYVFKFVFVSTKFLKVIVQNYKKFATMNRTEMDYYAVLNVNRDAPKEKIALAYRKLAIQLCPFRDRLYEREFVPDSGFTHMTPLSLPRQWEYINMAYDVLGNELYRSIYDRFGEAGLFQGIHLPNGYFPPYQYHGDHMKVYHEVFGTYSPYANVIDIITNPPLLYSSLEHGIGVRVKDPPVEKIINLELDEVRFGAVKLMHVLRQEFIDDKETRTEKRKKTLKLNISPGTTAGTRYCFREEGDRSPTKIPADIIFITADKPHPVFERRNLHDLVYRREIELVDALCGVNFAVETLDKRKLKVTISDVIHPGFVKILPGEGLPICHIESTGSKKKMHKNNEYGDMIIEFTIKFPNYLTREMKQCTRFFFNELSNMEKEAMEGPNPISRILLKQASPVF